MGRPSNILWLGLKELRSLASDPVLVLFILYAFSLSIITQARGVKSEVNNASLAFIDEDESQLSKELFAAFLRPQFQPPRLIAPADATTAMDRGLYMFIITIPNRFELDLRRGRPTEVQVNVDATAMQQANIGAGYIKNILTDRIASFIRRSDSRAELPLRVVVRKEFNPNGEASWFTAIVALINQITTLTVVLTGAALPIFSGSVSRSCAAWRATPCSSSSSSTRLRWRSSRRPAVSSPRSTMPALPSSTRTSRNSPRS